jgi:hypothetical protein
MPIHIKELHIKASFEGQKFSQTVGAGEKDSDIRLSEKEKAELIEICVEKIMEILKEQKER